MEVQQWYRTLSDRLAAVLDAGEARAVARTIITHYCPQMRWGAVPHALDIVDEEVMAQGNAAARRVEQGEPVQYVLEEAWFCGLQLRVTPAVLIPRPETEELVMRAGSYLHPGQTVVDIGTGSGCIALALQHRHPQCRVVGADVSEQALAIATGNGKRLSLPVEWVHLDLREEQQWSKLPRMDLLVSNPPYIPAAEAPTMDTRVTNHEPALALFVPDHTPLLFYELLIRLAATHLNPGGHLLAEVHEGLATHVADLWTTAGWQVTIHTDLQGKQRMVVAGRSGE